ncbi:hypothetical protein [Paludibacterium denitrificans]|uniref:Uncharacterized protein n=1 Tax=Paludibacterium denitrificans TaxID=2675226 RepID=A0A844G7T9_9NEIS|nr:hypothetical protein [Paludibacterium denitrificans]MTD32406.1 hypothetical protein [Paludibacterium denitrificans]
MAEDCTSELVHHRLKQLEQITARHGDILEEIRDSLKELVKLQVTHTTIMQQQQDHETRLRAIEGVIPTLKQSSKLGTAAVTAFLTSLVTALGTWLASRGSA